MEIEIPVTGEKLRLYYQRMFPFEDLVRWLCHDSRATNFDQREFSFTLENEVVVRFKSYQSWMNLKESVCSSLIYKIDIGAIFQVSLLNSLALTGDYQKKAIMKEFVIDIDMTDYDSIRTCCKDATVCIKCWKFLELAAIVLDRILREDFGFKHILWVFSGRRGIHCWVCDDRALKLSNEVRSAVADFLNIFGGNENSQSQLKSHIIQQNIHPTIQKSYKILNDRFLQIIIEQQLLALPENLILDYLLKNIQQPDIVSDFQDLQKNWYKYGNSSNYEKHIETIWNQIKIILKKYSKIEVLIPIVLTLLYPRIDVNVSKTTNHLLKSPFCIHPKTGKICVPLTLDQIRDFDPNNVPTLNQLIMEYDNTSQQPFDVYSSSLAPYLKIFKKFADDLEYKTPLQNSNYLNKNDQKIPTKRQNQVISFEQD